MNANDESRKLLVYLTGFMGSGKSTIAPILANALGYELVDIDREIELLTGKTVSEIFSELGEAGFRSIEKSVLMEISRRDATVVALGGGTVANESNLQIIKSSGTLVYLKVSFEELVRRLKFKTDRPLLRPTEQLASTEDSEFRQRIASLLADREQFYSRADITVVGDDRDANVVNEIVRRLRSRPS